MLRLSKTPSIRLLQALSPPLSPPLPPPLSPLNRLLSSSSSPTVPAALIKELRNLSNSAPLLACRKALLATYTEDGGYDVEEAMKELRKTEGEKTKGKIEGRAMGEGEERGWGGEDDGFLSPLTTIPFTYYTTISFTTIPFTTIPLTKPFLLTPTIPPTPTPSQASCPLVLPVPVVSVVSPSVARPTSPPSPPPSYPSPRVSSPSSPPPPPPPSPQVTPTLPIQRRS
jgi:hypothetical protein